MFIIVIIIDLKRIVNNERNRDPFIILYLKLYKKIIIFNNLKILHFNMFLKK